MQVRTYHNNSTSNRRCGADDREVEQSDFVKSVDGFEVNVCLLFCVTDKLYASRAVYMYVCVCVCVKGEEKRRRGEEKRIRGK